MNRMPMQALINGTSLLPAIDSLARVLMRRKTMNRKRAGAVASHYVLQAVCEEVDSAGAVTVSASGGNP